MLRANFEQHLDGVDAAAWVAMLNARVWLFTQQKHLTTLLSRYVPAGGQDVLTFDTARLLRAASGRLEVAAVAGKILDTIGKEPLYYTEIAERFSAYDFRTVARALGHLHATEKLWQDPRGRMCVRGSAFAATPPRR